MSTIYWFSGTGNSLHAAKVLSAELGGLPRAAMAGCAPAEAVGGAGEKIGFVFPSYYGDLPRIVRAYVEKLVIKPDTYLFAVVTMGAFGEGSVSALAALLKEKGHMLAYGRGVRMASNYVLRYDPRLLGGGKKRLDRADERLRSIARDIASGKEVLKTFGPSAGTLYKNIASLDEKFYAEGSCTGCGQCAKICPVHNIRLEEGKPRWCHRCEHCVACISWCPAGAIQYGGRTKSRKRHRHPRIAIHEMLGK